ncbi:MlaA family lipoprotein [Venatoribacter cucullus]|uniref:MlaA family lipoprotein n=1 Tax=Venatoribacter cucullus TaxID=2661630 RepID=UPI00223F6794|nr:VacJ family lipoprotein [Venatoribacter cucullus]UZK03598.1 VacJ family lipoprotein [Venatoribacter cucullus]
MRIVTLLLLSIMPLLASSEEANPDPWEGFNRKMFAFNETLDRHVARPLAQGYQAITPEPVDRSVSHFFSNFHDLTVIVNGLAQLKFGQALSDTARVLVNTTIGFFGIFDVATHIGLPKHNEDFGQTLGYWGVGSGPYLVLPLLGPSTVRDTGGLALEYSAGLSYVDMGNRDQGWAATGLYLVDTRAGLLASENLISGDRYTFIRSFYLQRREFLINDGVMEDDFGDDDWDSWEDEENWDNESQENEGSDE